MVRFSVILTTYNSSEFIKGTLDSIYAQEGLGKDFELEVIVVDDRSTDDTRSIVNQFDIIFLQNETNSGGPNKGRNVGLHEATGDYLCISDHDDIWHSDRVQSILPHIGRASIITSGYYLKEYGSSTLEKRSNKCDIGFKVYPKNQSFKKLLRRDKKGQICYLGSLVYSNELKHILFEEEYGFIDYDWLLSLFYMQESIEICRPLYTRMVDGQNLSLDAHYRELDHSHSLKAIKIYESDFEEEVRMSRKRIHGTYGRYLYLTGEMTKARSYFLKSPINWKTLAYYCTTFFGSGLVKKHFKIFG